VSKVASRCVSKVASRCEPKLCRISISTPRAELGEAMGSIRPGVHKRAKGNGFGGNVGENIKRVSGNDVRKVRDHGNAVPGIGSIIGRCVNRQGGMRKTRGRFRM
jgi:hypothetical protein